jgi:nucleoid-associated protein YgaU
MAVRVTLTSRLDGKMAYYKSSSRYRLSSGGVLANRVDPETKVYYQYVTREGDTFPLLASKLFNDGSRYWEIADINPQVQWPDAIPVGTVIRLPK